MPPDLSVRFAVQHPASFPIGTSDSPTIPELQTAGMDFIGLGGEIRTPDPLVPNQMRYQTALHRVTFSVNTNGLTSRFEVSVAFTNLY